MLFRKRVHLEMWKGKQYKTEHFTIILIIFLMGEKNFLVGS